jgi:hypothetical protein
MIQSRITFIPAFAAASDTSRKTFSCSGEPAGSALQWKTVPGGNSAGYTVESFKPEGGERTYRINK